MHLDTEHINSLIETQLAAWPEAKNNFDRLMECERRSLRLGDFEAQAQLNPARICSTAAKVDPESVKKRECFLCRDKRPAGQLCAEWPSSDWELLVNPYPILPVHFTIVSKEHVPQEEIPLDMAAMAEAAPDLCFFFNGARAGASAPDHLHCQAVLKSELPLVALTEKLHPSSDTWWKSSEQFGADLPFHYLSAVAAPRISGMITISNTLKIYGVDAVSGLPDKSLINAFFWTGADGLLRIVVVPRKAHRPRRYFLDNSDKMMISPGAIDMAGILIFPDKADFGRITPEIAREIYSDVAFTERLPFTIEDLMAFHLNLEDDE